MVLKLDYLSGGSSSESYSYLVFLVELENRISPMMSISSVNKLF